MRMIFGVLSLLFVVAVVGFLAKRQLASVNDIKMPSVSAPAADGAAQGAAPGAVSDSAGAPSIYPSGTVQQQSLQIQQQFKAAAEAAVQQPRAMPDEK